MVIECVRCRKIKTPKGWERQKNNNGKFRKLETFCPKCEQIVYWNGFHLRHSKTG